MGKASRVAAGLAAFPPHWGGLASPLKWLIATIVGLEGAQKLKFNRREDGYFNGSIRTVLVHLSRLRARPGAAPWSEKRNPWSR
jgi:hypothetical protein